MENLMEMECVINGEKYLVTVTKVEEAPTEKELNCEECPCKDICDGEMVKPSFEDFKTVEVDGDDLIQVPVSLVPRSMGLEEWLAIINEYGIILTD
jgi:hypothetical protein